MANHTVTNWFGDLVSHPQVVVDAHSTADVVSVLTDRQKYPAPVRAVGSNHSTAPCGTADAGTLLRMKMNRILHVGDASLTVEAGARHFELAKELEKRRLQFYVNTEIGSLSAGSAACAGTKDASMPGEYGQVGSYITGVKMVLPSGDTIEASEERDPELMRQVRSSYGTFGVITEVTYRIRPLTPMKVYHETFDVDDFAARIPELKARNESMMYYLFPFEDKITVEFRADNRGATGEPNRHAWALRNHLWGTAGPRLGHNIERDFSVPKIRYKVIDDFNALWRFQLEHTVRAEHTLPPDQIIDYPPTSDDSRYTFSLFAFGEEQFPQTLRDFVRFAKDYYRDHGYRSNLLYVGYWIMKDRQALLSYSWDSHVMTIDPVSTGNPGWHEFLTAYNEFCSERNGVPLFNQTWGVTPAIARKAFGDRLQIMETTRKGYDPDGRLLNDYMRSVLL